MRGSKREMEERGLHQDGGGLGGGLGGGERDGQGAVRRCMYAVGGGGWGIGGTKRRGGFCFCVLGLDWQIDVANDSI